MKETTSQDRQGSANLNKAQQKGAPPDVETRRENWDSSIPKNPGRQEGSEPKVDRPNIAHSPHG